MEMNQHSKNIGFKRQYSKKDPVMQFVEFQGGFYMARDCHRRTSIVRFTTCSEDNPILKGVALKSLTVDMKAAKEFYMVQAAIEIRNFKHLELRASRKKSKVRSIKGSKTEKFDTTFEILNRKTKRSTSFTSKNLNELFKSIQSKTDPSGVVASKLFLLVLEDH